MKTQNQNYNQGNNQEDGERTDSVSRGTLFALLTVSLVGIADAGYLTYTFFTKKAVNCSVLDGCNIVLGSQYASVGPVPLSIIGLVFYATVFGLALMYLTRKKKLYLNALLGITISGLIVSAILVYLQFAVINALCLYCLVSATLSLLLALFSAALYFSDSH